MRGITPSSPRTDDCVPDSQVKQLAGTHRTLDLLDTLPFLIPNTRSPPVGDIWI